jgi:hypothetical protein
MRSKRPIQRSVNDPTEIALKNQAFSILKKRFRETSCQTPQRTGDDVIAHCGSDACEAVCELLAIIRSLIHGNQALRESASPGFARRAGKRVKLTRGAQVHGDSGGKALARRVGAIARAVRLYPRLRKPVQGRQGRRGHR